MTQHNDLQLSQFAIRIKNSNSGTTIGGGVIYFSENLKNKIYILTAAHCLYEDGDLFKIQSDRVDIDILNPKTNKYETITHTIDFNLVSSNIDNDVAVLILDKISVEKIAGTLPLMQAVKERQSITTFVLKGFPNATQGKELACLHPTWTQEMTGVNKFQLNLKEDYNGWATGGFSGSGVFLNTNNQLYLFGIFTRFRPEDKGKVIYCQYLETINELLEKNYLPLILFTFLGEHGLDPAFFKTHIGTAIKNLGPRFNENLNFRLSIAQCFNDIAKDSVFKQKLLKCLDNWLLARRYTCYTKENDVLNEIKADYDVFRKNVIEWIPQLYWSAEKKIDIIPILNQINLFNEKLEKKRDELQELQWEERKREKDIDKKKNYNYHPPYEQEISHLRQSLNINNDFINAIGQVNIALSNYPCLLIKGDAGSGKSHLLGDIAQQREQIGNPTLLLLGQLFKKEQTVWQNIINQLSISCSKKELLDTFNSIGKQKGSRVLLLIDALNEGAGKTLWYNELAGFINEIAQYPFIGLVVTIRSTYWNIIVPASVGNDPNISCLTHEGFKGNEYAALRLFCEHYGLQQPNFPILAPEFTNPLLLQLICEGVKASKQKTFPQGFHGVTTIFSYYLKAISQKLIKKRDEYNLRPKLAQQAIYEVAQACFKQEESRVLPLEEAVALFDSKFTRYPNLLADLIHENVFIQTLHNDYKTNTNSEVIYFAYERFGDFFIAEELLKSYKSIASVKSAFHKGNELGKLLKDAYWRNKGIIEAMSVLLPEKYNLEIVEVFDWVFKGKHKDLLGNINEWLNTFLLDSLKWRSVSSINDKKLSNWFNSDKFSMRENEYFYRLIELTTIPNHPFNSDRLFRIFKSFSMPSRDSFWQQHLQYYNGKDDYGNAFPISRLIDWAWQPEISNQIDKETARLTAQTLAWVLSSTNRALRDKTTKAMVNLLEDQPDALIFVLDAFSDIDDLYISERLYAIAYGCALRTSKNNNVQTIAQYVFDKIFKEKSPPNHILLRDYACNTIEYALYKNISIACDPLLIRPPYKSKMPIKIPTAKEVEKYKMDFDAPDYRQKNGSENDKIYHSIMEWDFGRYTIDSALHYFSSTSFTFEQEYKDFLKKLKRDQGEWLKIFASFYKLISPAKQEKEKYIRILGLKKFNKMLTDFQQNYKEVEQTLKTKLNKTDYQFFKLKIIPHLENLKRTEDWQQNYFDSIPIRRWIVQRTFELGYNAKLHGSYDSSIEHFNNRSENMIERIGKKYQWIAFYEIMGMIADNYKIKDRFNSKSKEQYYQGPWQLSLRNVDPVFTRKNKPREDSDEELEDNEIISSNWSLDSSYNYWNQPNSTWVTNTQDLPDPKQIILRPDDLKEDWLYLNVNINWGEPKPIGHEKYQTKRKDIWYMIQGYIINKKDKSKIVKWLKQQNFRGRWLPENESLSSTFNRENFWSPVSKQNQKSEREWKYLSDTNFKVIVASSNAVGEMSGDKSGAHFYYDMPCQRIFEGMKLEYSLNDGEFKNSKDEIIVTNLNPKGVLVRKKDLLKFLNENNLEIIWTLLGEKRDLSESSKRGENLFSTISGVYYFENEMLWGTLSLSEDN